jgi:hypothetical protein
VIKIAMLLILVLGTSATWQVPTASAADKPISGSKLLLRQPADSSQWRFLFQSKDPNLTLGSNGDSDTPTINGASLLIFNPVTSECQCMILPASRWELGPDLMRYIYRDPTLLLSPIKVALIRQHKVRILGRGANLSGITLDETTQGGIAVHYTSGVGSKLCTVFDSNSTRVDRPGAFLALNAPAPSSCLPEPAGCTPCVPPIVP